MNFLDKHPASAKSIHTSFLLDKKRGHYTESVNNPSTSVMPTYAQATHESSPQRPSLPPFLADHHPLQLQYQPLLAPQTSVARQAIYQYSE